MSDFKESKVWHFDDDEERIDLVELYLPLSVSEEVQKSTRDAAERARREYVERKLSTPNEPALAPQPEKKAAPAKESANAEEIKRLQCQDASLSLTTSTVKIFNTQDALTLLDKCKVGDRESQSIYTYWYKKLFRDGLGSTCRSVSSFPASELRASFDALSNEFPHFSQVVEHIRKCFELAHARQTPPKIRPVLLVGPPGVGKTHFCANLAQLLRVPLHKIAFDTEVTSSRLLGSDRHWGNSTPGQVIEALADEVANPVLLLDEIDKARGSGFIAQQNPIASLHGLLEPVTASSVQDISLSLRFDASWITFVGTTNNVGAIPLSLRSRFSEFLVLEPTGEDALKFASNLLRVTHKRLDIPGFDAPRLKLSKHAAHLEARSQIKVYEAAYSAAVAAGRKCLEERDLLHALGEESSDASEGFHLH